MKIPKLPASKLNEIFVETKDGLFGAIDSNLESWLQQEQNDTAEVDVEENYLEIHKDNQELIESFGGEKKIITNHTLSPQQIKFLVENQVLQANGLSNLFFVYSKKESKLFIIGVVFDKSISKYVPYIYRTRNVYRAWTKGNKIFVKK